MTFSQDQDTPNGTQVPHDLEKQASDRFEKLHSEGQLIWQPFLFENAEDRGFKVQFQMAPHLALKPSNPLDSNGGRRPKGIDPFDNPDPSFVLAYPGPDHTLMLNKFPVFKDSLIIHTNAFKLQSDDLDETDLAACWYSLQALRGKAPIDQRQWTMIYNCGKQAGSSQGHKHMQLWPLPSSSELGFEIFASKAESTTEITSLPGIPFKHFILRLSQQADVAEVAAAHARLLSKVQQVHVDHGSKAYNVAMTKDWLMLVPRCSSGGQYRFGGNTAVVLGLIWICGSEERRLWDEYGICKHLARLGVPA